MAERLTTEDLTGRRPPGRDNEDGRDETLDSAPERPSHRHTTTRRTSRCSTARRGRASSAAGTRCRWRSSTSRAPRSNRPTSWSPS